MSDEKNDPEGRWGVPLSVEKKIAETIESIADVIEDAAGSTEGRTVQVKDPATSFGSTADAYMRPGSVPMGPVGDHYVKEDPVLAVEVGAVIELYLPPLVDGGLGGATRSVYTVVGFDMASAHELGKINPDNDDAPLLGQLQPVWLLHAPGDKRKMMTQEDLRTFFVRVIETNDPHAENHAKRKAEAKFMGKAIRTMMGAAQQWHGHLLRTPESLLSQYALRERQQLDELFRDVNTKSFVTDALKTTNRW